MPEFRYFDGSTPEEGQQQFLSWASEIRDPATELSEGVRRLVSKNRKAMVEYEVAQLAERRWAVRVRCSYLTGDMSGVGIPWTETPSRDACLEHFHEHAQRHFESAKSGTQEETRRQMHLLLNQNGLFGFIEPNIVADETKKS